MSDLNSPEQQAELQAGAPGASAPVRPASGPLSRVLRLYRPEAAAAPLTDPQAARQAYTQWRVRMFVGMFVGYAILYFCRKNISTALPVMATDLGYMNVQLGLIGTSLYVTYGIGKFLNGILADRSNIRVFMATGLIISGILNLVFGSLYSIWFLALIWGMNGWFQSMGFPPIAKGMTIWYPPKGKATRWAFWTCSHQAGTAAVMVLTAWILTWGDWRYCFYIPGVLTIIVGIGLLWLLADTPESKGLESAKAFEEEPAQQGKSDNFRALFIKHVLLNRNVWVIGLIDLCVYVVRYGTLDWTTKFMIEEKGYTAAAAAFRAGLMPMAGIVGVLLSGFISDAVFKGRYRTVNAVFLVMLALCMYGFHESGSSAPVLDLLLLAGIGFFVEGPQSILGGVGAVDAGGSARVASSAAGLVGILAYTGASLSGVGTGLFIDNYGWWGAYGFWIGCAAVGFLLCMVAWREKPSPRHSAPAAASAN